MPLMSCVPFAGYEWHALSKFKIVLDGIFPFLYIPLMAKHIVKVDKSKGNFRVNIPKTIIKNWSWENVNYVILDDTNDMYLLLRRLVYDTAYQTDD